MGNGCILPFAALAMPMIARTRIHKDRSDVRVVTRPQKPKGDRENRMEDMILIAIPRATLAMKRIRP